jgi:prepilin-type N-terminal cleavage/methylation domain-containing protein
MQSYRGGIDMNQRRKNQNSGFTIVELLIVIVVIGILAALVITTYAGIQSKARNAHRQSDMQSLQTQIEAFYSQNAYYPSLGDMNTASWLTTNMKSLDSGALVDPSNATGSSTLVRTAVAKSYAYAPTSDGAGTVCGSDTTSGGTDTTCAYYTLTATYEGTVNGASTVVRKNLD